MVKQTFGGVRKRDKSSRGVDRDGDPVRRATNTAMDSLEATRELIQEERVAKVNSYKVFCTSVCIDLGS